MSRKVSNSNVIGKLMKSYKNKNKSSSFPCSNSPFIGTNQIACPSTCKMLNVIGTITENSYFPSTSPTGFHGKGVIRIDPLMEWSKIGPEASIRTLVFSAYPFTRLYFSRRNNTTLYIHKLYEFLSRT
jgi:hypothetical protein